ncbi:hypothetical protein [Arsenicicoccus dermatophilus]|uniref:hypothetical protein n=1 Tax=Arsenicicoccus dermatophilus TaxID=1076331 RepID=UPI001F4CA596|nr:hypothetical protein [Arsenicicoccus dermatophilus]MCH8611784.1 hypothetical protein [Arsenicicoccus dermatophilus]
MMTATNEKSPAVLAHDEGQSGYVDAGAAHHLTGLAEALLHDLAGITGLLTIWRDAYQAGHRDGRAEAEAEMAPLHRHAVRTAQSATSIPARDHQRDRDRRARIERRWAA